MATRSSGMKQNAYGNIEDLIVRIRMVTPKGTMERNFLVKGGSWCILFCDRGRGSWGRVGWNFCVAFIQR